MLAAVFHGNADGLKVEYVPDPQIADDEVLIRVEACGLCHTDLHYLEHGVPTFKKPPIILGHEAAGIVEKIGSNSSKLRPGMKVLIPSVLPCGQCWNCSGGRGNICSKMQMPGNHIDGGFAQYVKLKEWHAMVLPESIDLSLASTISDAVSTAYHAVMKRAKVHAGQNIAVFGCGGVGINVVQIAKLVGAHVTAMDKLPSKLELAMEFGASVAVDPSDEKTMKSLKSSIDIAFECIGKSQTITLAHSLIKPGGTLVIVGYCSEYVPMAVHRIMFQEQQIVGSLGCTLSSLYEVIRLASEKKLILDKLVSNKYPLAKIKDAVEELKKGKCLRNVIEPWK